ncbi:restriction endonuclease subunit S [Flavobacterium sp. HXWNR29]|uniref:restriction endonuclease subunit S n=1 Tax=Flavobacterium odoriferum TaxID=2946604 RepID=UPI0021CB53CC|nr:restriction endonuclease subunit S [Flavobacterium sp. HXWNR29]MCU4188643.1 restriction endonuclease subunit S [Flavobacterium sp. HXWNR29]
MEKLVPKLRFPEFQGNWEEKKLKNVSNYFNGGSFENDVKEEGRYELITLKSVDMSGNLAHSKRYLDIEVPTLKKGTLVMILSEQSPGLLGMTAIISEENKYVLNQRVAEIRPKSDVVSYFLSMAINRNQKYFSKHGAGTKVQNISKPNVENYTFLCPKPEEQQKIATFLTSVDERLTLLAQQKEKLELYKKGVMQQIFSQKLRFKDENGKDYPDWEEKNFNEIIERTSTGLNPRQNFTLGKGNNYYVTIKNISNGKLDFKSCEMIDDDALKLIKKRSDLSKNDIIMSSIGNIGEAYLLKEEPTNWNINESVFMIRSKKEVVMPLFMYYILSNDYTKRYFENNMTGSSFKSIKIGDLKLMPVEIPCLEEQQKIASFLSAIDVQIEGVSKKIEQTKLFKKGLLQQMFV